MNRTAIVERIAAQLAAIVRKYPERIRHDSSRRFMPGTYIKVRDDYTVWVGNHYVEWPDAFDLQRIEQRLDGVMDTLGVRA